MELKSVGAVVRQRREERGLSQSGLAHQTGISPAQISRLESGERADPSFQTIAKIAEVLGMSLDDLAQIHHEDPGVDGEDWKRAGFEQVDEVVPGRIYEAWADNRHFRVSITRAIARGSSIKWNSSIDENVTIMDSAAPHDVRLVWTSTIDVPSRLRGDTPDEALREAMRWLANWGGFDATGRARRDAADAAEMDPELRKVVDAIDTATSKLKLTTWRDRTRAKWSDERYDVFVSRDGEKQFAMMTYYRDALKLAQPVVRFPLTMAGAKVGAARIQELVAS